MLIYIKLIIFIIKIRLFFFFIFITDYLSLPHLFIFNKKQNVYKKLFLIFILCILIFLILIFIFLLVNNYFHFFDGSFFNLYKKNSGASEVVITIPKSQIDVTSPLTNQFMTQHTLHNDFGLNYNMIRDAQISQDHRMAVEMQTSIDSQNSIAEQELQALRNQQQRSVNQMRAIENEEARKKLLKYSVFIAIITIIVITALNNTDILIAIKYNSNEKN